VPEGRVRPVQAGHRRPRRPRPAPRGRKLFADYKAKYPKEAAELETMEKRELPAGWDKDIPTFPRPTRRASPPATVPGRCSTRSPRNVPWIVGGSADLKPLDEDVPEVPGTPACSRRRRPAGGTSTSGVPRARPWGAVMNGMAQSKLRSYGSGFLIFSDYGRAPDSPRPRSWACRCCTSFTHDSIGVGEDGPTHQPIEQIMSLRAIPNLILIRPGDAKRGGRRHTRSR